MTGYNLSLAHAQIQIIFVKARYFQDSSSKHTSVGLCVPGMACSVICTCVLQVRAKESAKNEAAMLRRPEEEVRLARIGRLPELARILRKYP